MRRIIKGSAPEELIAWKATNHSGINYTYDELPGATKLATKEALLNEQGWLCGYTGITLTETDSHIEHFKPQNRCSVPGEDTDYRNLLAAYPGKDQAGNASIGFGAPFKAEKFDEVLLISPWTDNCGQRFAYNLVGNIAPKHSQDSAARFTISTLGLDHPNLVNYRRSAITAFTADPDRKRSLTALKRLLEEVDRPDRNGKLRQFCFALKQALKSVIAKAEKRQQQRSFARRQPRP